MISWMSVKKTSIVVNIAKIEYITVSLVSCEAMWFQKLLAILFHQLMESIMIYYDNQSCVKLTTNPYFHDMLKRIQIKYHFICEMVQKGGVKLQYISTSK